MRHGAQRIIRQAVEAELVVFLEEHAESRGGQAAGRSCAMVTSPSGRCGPASARCRCGCVRRHLVQLKLAVALERLDETLAGLERGQISPVEALDRLLAEECAGRETRRIRSSLMTARLTQIKTLESFDFSFQPSLDRNRILTLAPTPRR